MPRNVVCGLIQCCDADVRRRSARSPQVRDAMFEKHLPFIEEAGKKGVQILCLQEVFNGPYFCPSQDPRWYDVAEAVPGPTVERLAEVAKKYQMAMVVPRLRARDGRRLLQHRRGHRRRRQVPRQVPQEPHPADLGLLGEVLLQARQPRLPDVPDALREDRRLHLLRPPLPRGRARCSACTAPRSSSTRRPRSPGSRSTSGSSSSPRTRSRTATSSAASNRVGTEAPWNIGKFYGSSYFFDPRGQTPRAGVARTRTSWSSPTLDLDMIEEVRRTWQFFRDRRPGRLPGPRARACREETRAMAQDPADQGRHGRHRDRPLPRRRAGRRTRRSR